MTGFMAGLIAVDAGDAQAARGHPATPTALAPADFAALIVVMAPILALVVWALARVRRARTAVRAALAHGGYAVVRLEQPFDWGRSFGRRRGARSSTASSCVTTAAGSELGGHGGGERG